MSNITIERSRNVVVKVTTTDGVVGWGEGVEALGITGENQRRMLASVDALGDRIIGADPLRRTDIWLGLTGSVYGNRTAIGAIDIALHDIAGRVYGVPVSALLGGASRQQVPALTLLGSGDRETDLAEFERRRDAGYRWFKLKVGIGEIDAEADTIREMADRHRDTVVCGDANGAWTEQQSARFLSRLDGSRVRFVEQPTMDTAALVRLAERSPVALCADESARSLDDIVALGRTAVAGVSLKLIKHGGISGIMRGATLCDQMGLRINLAGKVAESSISAAANLHAAAAMSDTAFGCSPAHAGLTADVTGSPPALVDGVFAVPDGPGLGIDVDEDLIRSLAD